MCFVDLLDWHVAIDEFFFILRRVYFLLKVTFIRNKVLSLLRIIDKTRQKRFNFFCGQGQLFSEKKLFWAPLMDIFQT